MNIQKNIFVFINLCGCDSCVSILQQKTTLFFSFHDGLKKFASPSSENISMHQNKTILKIKNLTNPILYHQNKNSDTIVTNTMNLKKSFHCHTTTTKS